MAIACLISVSSYAGGNKIDIASSDNKVTRPGVFSVFADWIKEKDKKYDLNISLINEHSKPVIVLMTEMKCFRGKAQGELKHTFFNTGEKTIQFASGQLKNFNLVCKSIDQKTGEYGVAIGNIYENASGDGRTLGKVLAKDITWQIRVAQ
jgi:hypothetical protein